MARSASGTTDGVPLLNSVLSGCVRGRCLKPISCRPAKLLRPSVWMVEPGATFCVMKAVDRRRPEVRDDCHTGTPRSSSALLNGDHDECRAAPPELAAPADPGLGTANPGVVDFYLAVKRLARRIHRRSPELVQYHPSGFVTLKTKLVLEKQRRDPALVGRHQVGRPEPEGQRGLRIVKDCPRCQRDLVTTGGALPASSSHQRVTAIVRAHRGHL
jgi:hypothetical protein